MFNSWIDRGDELASEFQAGDPFPLLLIDDFLDEETAEGLLAEFPAPDAMPKSRDYMFGDKRELSSVAEQGPVPKALSAAWMGLRSKRSLARPPGKALFVAPAFTGVGSTRA